MARYINAEQMKGDIKIAMANQQSKNPHNLLPTHLAEILCQFADDTPTADVVPRGEVANKICCEIEEEIVAALESNYRTLKEWDDGRCNDYILEMVNRIKGKIDALRGIEAFVEELKKKYKEGGK